MITTSGFGSFVSEAWGGRASDVKIVMESGILDLLQAGDSIIADKGFPISALLKERKCTLNIPPFKGKSDSLPCKRCVKPKKLPRFAYTLKEILVV